MPQDSGDRLQIRNMPWTLWIVSGAFIVIGLLPVVIAGEWTWLLLAAGGLLAIALLTDISSLTAERGKGTVTLTKWTLLRGRQRREIPTGDITRIAVESTPGSEGPVYRVALALASGEQIPLRNYYTGKQSENLAEARRMSDFLGLEGTSQVPVVTDGTTGHEQTGQTGGIDWRLETLVANDGGAVTRWSMKAGACADGLLVLSQMDAGLGRLPWSSGPLAQVSKWAYKSLLLDYRFEEADAEAIDALLPFQELDPQLRVRWAAFATAPATARQWLSPERVKILADWAAAHPSPHIQTNDALMLGAIVLLAGPSGLWLVVRGTSQDSARIAMVTDLGAALAAARVSAPLTATESGD